MAYDRFGKYINPDVIDADHRRCGRITVCDGISVVVGELKSLTSEGVLIEWRCQKCRQQTFVPVPGTFPPPDPHPLENPRDEWRILRDGSDYLEVAPDEHDWRL